MNEIIFEKGVNDWKVASFIFQHDGMFNEFDDYFSIWTENGCFRFNDGDKISFIENKFKIN